MARACILDLGRLESDFGWQVAMTNPSRVSDRNPPRLRVPLPVMAALVESRGHVILYDTGCHPDAMHGRWPPAWADLFAHSAGPNQTLPEQLKLAGHTVGDITDVVLSHLHMDHAGNVSLFPAARIWVHRREIEFALAERLTATEYVGPYVVDDWLLPGLNWRFVYGRAAITDEVQLTPLPGHAPGVLCMEAQTASRTLIFPSDAMFSGENLGPPPRLPGLLYDSAGFRETADLLTYMRDRKASLVVFPHDPEQFGSILKAPNWYE